MLKQALLAGAALTLLAAPAGATAKPTKTDRTNASEECRTERGTDADTREAFRVKYGDNKNGKNAFGKCVSRTARDEEAERERAAKSASKDCRDERAADAEEFAETYGTNKNGKNAMGKCVSAKAKEKREAADRKDAERAEKRKSAAKECAAERASGRKAFADKYGTGAKERNAFGRCVSQTAKA